MKFEKISLNEAIKDLTNVALPLGSNLKTMLSIVKLPERATAKSAGYDFYLPYDIVIKPHETKRIFTCIRAQIDDGYVLLLMPRSSLGCKYKLAFDNTIPVIDADYYNAKNEGHIILQMTNNGNDIIVLKHNDRICQGIFVKFETIDDEKTSTNLRTGGFGSTGV